MNELQWFVITVTALIVCLGVATLFRSSGTIKEPTYRIREVYAYYDPYNAEVHHYLVEKKGKFWGWNKIGRRILLEEAKEVVTDASYIERKRKQPLVGPYYFTSAGTPHPKE